MIAFAVMLALLAAGELPAVVDLGQLGGAGSACAGPSNVSKTGTAVCGGFDLDGDGRDDVVIGAAQASPFARAGAGAVYVVLGSANPSSTIDFAAPPANVVTIAGAQAGDALGIAVRAGFDFDGDGNGDLALSAWSADPLGRVDAGAVYVLRGGAALPAVIDLAGPPAGTILIAGATAGSALGIGLDAIPDADGDGRDELVLGAPLADPVGRMNAGVCWIVRGAAAPPALIDLAIPGGAALTVLGHAAGASLGNSVASGLRSGTSFAIACGAPGANPFGRIGAGAAFVVPLTSLAGATVDLATPPQGVVEVAGAASGDQAGYAIGNAGDRDGDGAAELAIGCFRAKLGTTLNVGRIDVVDLASAAPVVDLAVTTPALRVLGSGSSAQLGNALAPAFDFDGDGYPDLLAGMRGYDIPGATDVGAGVLVRRTVSLGALVDLAAPPPQVHLLVGAAAFDRAGYSVGNAGDQDGDGFPDLVVGAINASPNGASTGAAYVVFGAITDVKASIAWSGSALAGGSLALSASGPPNGAVLWLAAAATLAHPLPVFQYAYAFALDPTAFVIFPPLPIDAQGQSAASVPFPSVPALAGVPVAFQALGQDPVAGGAFSALIASAVP